MKPTIRRNSRKACSRCRVKRQKCDGTVPSEAHPGNPCTRCTRAFERCPWDMTRDGRLAPTRRDHDQLAARIKVQDRQISVLWGRLCALGDPGNVLEDIEIEENVNDGNDPASVDELACGFSRLVLEEDKIMYYGVSSPFADLAAPMSVNPRLPAIEGFQHSTSRMHEIRPMHSLGGPGVDSNSTKWDKFLPRAEDGSRLITRAQHDHALELFFRFTTSWTLRMIPHFFLRDLVIATEAPDPKPQINHYSPMLHNAVIAVALAFSDDSVLRERSLRDKFISQAKLTWDSECQRPTLSTVQGLAFLSSYCSGMGSQTLGFMYFGMAIRVGQALGLHVRIPDGKIANDDRIERNWVYWNIFIHDKIWSLYVGRNQGLPTTQGEMRDPPIDFRMDSDRWFWRASDGRVINKPAFLSSTFAEMVKLSRIASHIMAAVYDKHLAYRLRLKMAQINKIWSDLRNWHQSLRGELRIDNPGTAMEPAHIFQLHLMYEWMVLLLLGPFYKPYFQDFVMLGSNEKDNEDLGRICRLAGEECPGSASRVLDLLRTYDTLFTLRLSPLTNVQIAYHAGRTLMRTVSTGYYGGAQATQAGHEAREKVRECVKQLRVIGGAWSGGVTTAEILEKDLEAEIEKQNKVPVFFRWSPTPPNPPTPKPAATRVPTPSPKAVPIVSPWFVSPNDYFGAANTAGLSSGSPNTSSGRANSKRRASPPNGPYPKRPVYWARNDETRYRDPSSQGPYEQPANLLPSLTPHLPTVSYLHMPVLSVNEQNHPRTPVVPTLASTFDFQVPPDHLPLFSTAPPTFPQDYIAPPYPPPSSQSDTTDDYSSELIDLFGGNEMHTSMSQWLPAGDMFSEAPSFETPVLPFPIVPYCVDPANGCFTAMSAS